MNLFEEIVSEDKQHVYFNSIKDDKEVKRILNEWAYGFKDRDGKFIKEFQTTFNSSFWELYCYAVFKKLNLKVDFDYSSPDFVLSKENINLNVECVIAKNAQGDLEESDSDGKLYDKTSLEEKVYKQTLRLLNSINYKNKRYLEHYYKIDNISENPFIVALAPFDQPRTMDVALEAIHMVLYGINYDKKTLMELEIIDVKKNENVNLELGIFTNKSYENIDAIMFSNVATIGKVRGMGETKNCIFHQRRFNKFSNKSTLSFNYRINNDNYMEKELMKIRIKDIAKNDYNNIDHKTFSKAKPLYSEGYKEELVDGLHIFINPFSKKQLSKEIIDMFTASEISVTTYDVKNKNIIKMNDTDDYLIQRFVERY